MMSVRATRDYWDSSSEKIYQVKPQNKKNQKNFFIENVSDAHRHLDKLVWFDFPDETNGNSNI